MRYTLFILILLLSCPLAFAQPAATGDKAAQPAAADSEEAPADADASADGEAPAEGEQPADGEASEEGEEGEAPAEQSSAFWSTLDDIASSGPLGMIRDGGIFMYPILFLGILAAGVIIERYRSLKMLGTDSLALRTQVRDLLQEDRVEEALAACDAGDGPAAAVLSCGLRKYLVLQRLNYDMAKVDEQVVKSMEDYSVHIVAALERHLPVLATISSVAPMLGFLGTVAGMITSFDDIKNMFSSGGGSNIVEAAAGGISVALLTTCFGLIVGIPAFMAYNYFTGVINRFVLEVEESSTELIENVTLQLAIRGQEQAEGENHAADAETLQAANPS
ncbi:MotA/TolQ/ExbB proton channel family protein [Lignipirellula cremea]|uniref:Biopolymer transport protein ExbB n=1 Tax=Lignipirellula cremea TaxID=2528010 RepID=A0A518DM89_9BACT|nr:MotA/TolQ/ExbB proton channel family protein [Lignipirellula cremea]QDU92956.1 Biopolymer transport protein ExbB [Lignipirellula cremea]